MVEYDFDMDVQSFVVVMVQVLLIPLRKTGKRRRENTRKMKRKKENVKYGAVMKW